MDNQQSFDPYSQNSVTSPQNSQGVYFKDRMRMIIERINYYLVRILPTIGNFITFVFFYLRKIIVSFIKIALEQIKF